jgi:O-antigen/teichoic acid export membrane protein
MPAVRGVPPTGPDGGGSRETDGDRPRRPTRGRRSAIRDIWSLAPSYLVPGVASFVAVPALFATLGPAEYGRWALIYAVAAGVPQVTTSWLEARVVRFGHRQGRSGDRGRAALAAGGSTLLAAPLALLVLPGASQSEVLAAVLLTAVVSLYLLEIARLQARMAFGSVSLAATVRSIAGAVLGIAGAVATGRAWVAIAGLATGYVVGQLLGELWMRRRQHEQEPPPGEGRPQRRERPFGEVTAPAAGSGRPGGADPGAWSPPAEGAGYGIASGANATAQYVLSVGDRFVLSTLRSPAEVGVYTATYALVDLAARFAPGVVITAVRPRVFRAADVGSTEAHGALLTRLAALLAGIVAVGAIGLLALSLLVPALPVEATLVGPIAIGLTCFVAANSLAVLYSAGVRQGRLAAHGIAAASACLALNLALVPGMGPLGAGVATAGSYAVLVALNASGLPAIRRVDRDPLLTFTAAIGSLVALTAGTAVGGPVLGLALATLVLVVSLPWAIRTVAAIRSGGSGSGGLGLEPAIAPAGRHQDAEREPQIRLVEESPGELARQQDEQDRGAGGPPRDAP